MSWVPKVLRIDLLIQLALITSVSSLIYLMCSNFVVTRKRSGPDLNATVASTGPGSAEEGFSFTDEDAEIIQNVGEISPLFGKRSWIYVLFYIRKSLVLVFFFEQ